MSDGNEEDRMPGEEPPQPDPVDEQQGQGGSDETALGDTAEGHEDIGVHDLPPDHPGRHKAEELAKDRGDDGGEAVRTPRS